MKKIMIVHGDDWQGLYIDDLLVYENHNISSYALMEALKVQHAVVGIDDAWLSREGRLPLNFKDIPEDKIK